MKKMLLMAIATGLGACATLASDDPFFHSTDPLAPHDEWGLVHQMPIPNSTDFEPRYSWRPLYYLESGHDLSMQRAYIGALQRDLIRLGYYCGPIDGYFSPAVSDAIARLQKSYSMHVTGTLTVPVRRALHLP